MGLFGDGNGEGVYFLIIMIVLLAGIVFIARADNDAFAVPSFDFNAAGVSAMFELKDNNLPDGNYSSVDLFPKSAGGTKVSAFFCPQDACAKNFIEKIDSSKESIYVAIYSFTHDGIADAMIRAKQRGVEVKVIFDSDQSANDSSEDERLVESGVSVARRNGSGYMHNKFAVIDGSFVATGSFNYSDNANMRNEENLVFIEDISVAKKFKEDFDGIWEVSKVAN